ncbi:hypothetical protein [Fictibacillus sp. BK138]|uniref:hypothetical protein n=1 Tax=Fictibacillus sp. BK138 TaxID=2512121 RepID=UPI00102A4A5E|nr:hypothetical protein [Fictibacillus sp. BK138]RZT23129.1 hypothetical protein EV282_2215 [Fictibacillus sp. BK138]
MKTILIAILTSGITSGIVLGLYRHFLSRNIESYKNTLLFDLQRKVHDFQLFAAKKHEEYADLYSTLHVATDELLNFTSWFKEYPSFQGYTENELDNYLEQHNLIQSHKLRIKSLWETDKWAMQSEIHKIIEWNKRAEADRLRLIAYQNYSQSLIYQSKEVAKICEEITQKHVELILDFDLYNDIEPNEKKEVRKKIETHKERLRVLREELHKVMHSELTIGYYEKSSE